MDKYSILQADCAETAPWYHWSRNQNIRILMGTSSDPWEIEIRTKPNLSGILQRLSTIKHNSYCKRKKIVIIFLPQLYYILQQVEYTNANTVFSLAHVSTFSHTYKNCICLIICTFLVQEKLCMVWLLYCRRESIHCTSGTIILLLYQVPIMKNASKRAFYFYILYAEVHIPYPFPSPVKIVVLGTIV